MKLLADNELEDTYAMRESLFVCREKARNILRAQQERTEHTIRKRIFETQRARNELEWQMLKVCLFIKLKESKRTFYYKFRNYINIVEFLDSRRNGKMSS